jgi:hypothetical protein
VTDDSAFQKQVRARMAETGEKYAVARRMVIAGRDPGQPPVALRVYLNPHVDLGLTGQAARAYAAADEPGQRDMANRLLADHIEMAGSGEAGVAAGSEILAVQQLRIEEIGELVRRRIGQAAGVASVSVGGDLDQVRVSIHAARPGVVSGHGGAGAGRLRAELEELTGKPVLLAIGDGGLARGRGRVRQGPGAGTEEPASGPVRRRRGLGAAAGPAYHLDHGGLAVVRCGLCPTCPMCPAVRLGCVRRTPGCGSRGRR